MAVTQNPGVGVPDSPFDLPSRGILPTSITPGICLLNRGPLNDAGVSLDTKEETIDTNNALAEWTEEFLMPEKCELYEVTHYDNELLAHANELTVAMAVFFDGMPPTTQSFIEEYYEIATLVGSASTFPNVGAWLAEVLDVIFPAALLSGEAMVEDSEILLSPRTG
jgi:hypothetical protein